MTSADDEVPGLLQVLAQVADPRKRRGRRYRLVFVLAVAVVCVLAGAKNFREPGDQAADLPQEVLARLGGKPHPLRRKIIAPSETRLRTLIQGLDANALDELIGGWLRALAGAGRLKGLLRAIAIDGKWQRGVADGQVKLFAALLHQDKVIIAQRRIPDQTNEITQVRELLDPVDLTGAVVTADAAHAQDDTAEYLAGERDSDYFLFVKGNRPGLQRAIYHKVNADCPGQPDHAELDYGHGPSSSASCGSPMPGASISRTPARSCASAATATTSPAPRSAKRPCTPSPACTPATPAPRTWPPSPRASGAPNPCTGSATPPGPKTRTPATPATAPRPWPPSATSRSACSTYPASPRSPAPCKPSPATGPGS
ncbi:MAG: ISAs1 family transposase [Streptosporangiaceae bacterium]|nr:ISAs1 family transposase [Streptosporangiaceae bacterium]